MTTSSTHLSGHVHGEEAVEIVARAIRPEGHHLMCDHANPCNCHFQRARDKADTIVAALTAAGLLATEQEWGIGFNEDGMRLSRGSEETARADADRMHPEVGARVVSRGVTAWREQA